MKKVFAVTAALMLLGLGVGAQADVFNLGSGLTNLETVFVGDAGNQGDRNYGYGSFGAVEYNYNIGKYEVTAAQYTEFLNAKAKTDAYGLYSTYMSNTSYGCGITRNGESGNYTYSVANNFANRPVNYVSYWDSCRFANWLSNGQGDGDTENGAYTIPNGYNGWDGKNIQRNTGWTWAVASENEWYKAAYYKGGSTNAGYWLYPTCSDTAPGQDMGDVSGNNANYRTGPDFYPIDSGKYTTVVGEFQNSDSPYGTFDQGGNVWEWNEAITLQYTGNAYRGWRGASFTGSESLQSAYRSSGGYPTYEYYDVGFRVVQTAPVPEPSSLMVFAGGLVSLLGLRMRRK